MCIKNSVPTWQKGAFNMPNVINILTIKLKNGKTVKLRGHETFYVRGQVAFSHFLTPVSSRTIEKKNAIRDEWTKKGSGPFYSENVNLPYREIVLKNVSLVPKNDKFITYGERFAKDKFYGTAKVAGAPKIDLKNYLTTVKMAKRIGDEDIPCDFEGELAPDSDVICEGVIYFNKEGKPGIALGEVVSVGEPRYFQKKSYKSNAKE